MITLDQYFGSKEHTADQRQCAIELLNCVNALLDEAHDAGVYDYEIDQDTGTQISGSKGGSGDGGFRLPTSTTGSAKSSHKDAKGVDVFDPQGRLDKWITRTILVKHRLYREHPDKTVGWAHLTTRCPGSGCRTFLP